MDGAFSQQRSLRSSLSWRGLDRRRDAHLCWLQQQRTQYDPHLGSEQRTLSLPEAVKPDSSLPKTARCAVSQDQSTLSAATVESAPSARSNSDFAADKNVRAPTALTILRQSSIRMA